MYKIFCDSCEHYNYSASRIGKWVCSYCGRELASKISITKTEKNKTEKLA